MKGRYERMASEVALDIDQLRRQVIALEGHLASLPNDNEFKASLTEQQKTEIKQLRTQLSTELKAVREDLKFYEGTRKI
ncbi:hypothetical protein [Legionella norrlandica]|uniref:hypothetical protein n=1 Tax=Legionella norrlandica TaxID=1498499 RepID=UPI001F4D31E4|nr:hypothetical protein [Legionella norrlandica]